MRSDFAHDIVVTAIGVRISDSSPSSAHTSTSRAIDWSWVNEYTGAAFHRFDGLRELASDGAQATAWFEAWVQPLIKGDHE